jgi:iron complex outermembrane recepter protein
MRLALTPITLALLALPALAQQQGQQLDKVVVTGSNVKRLDAETATPVQVFDRAAIERLGVTNAGELLRTLSANSAGSYNEASINNQSGAAGVSLRGLGQKSTLVLINGRRMANHAIAQNGQDTFVDLNAIPKSAIQRIEVLKDGASAIYGSDAIAGVVNVILRKDLEHVEVGATTGRATQGGLAEHTLNLAGGFSLGSLRVIGVVDYFHRDMLVMADRPWLNGLDFRHLPGGSFFPGASGGTWQRAAVFPASQFPPGGFQLRRQAIPNCLGDSKPMDALIGAGVYSGTACTYTVDKYLTAYPEADRLGGMLSATMDLGAGMELFAEAGLSKNESSWINQPQTLTNQTVVFTPLNGGFAAYSNVIPNIPAHAALFATNTLGGNGTTARFNTTFFDVGARTFALTTDAQRLLAGVRGRAGRWDWEAAVGHSRSKVVSTTGNQVDAQVLRGFINNGGYNFLAPTAEQTNALRVSTTRNAESKLDFADLKASTTLMALEGGDLGLAVGVEARRESMFSSPDALAKQGRLLGTGSSEYSGERKAAAAYAELVAPVKKGVELQFAGRFDKYNDFGSAFSPKVGAKIVFTPQALLRASVARGFRAPTLVENASSNSLGFSSVVDPLRNNASTIIGVLVEGARNLKAERSLSRSIGLVLQPTTSASVSLDYFHITQNDLVSLQGEQFIVRNPALFPGQVVRDPVTNTILVVTDRYSNLAEVSTEGLDLEATLRLPDSAMGRFTLRASATQMLAYEYQPRADAQAVDHAGLNTGPFGAMPKLKARFGVDWRHDAWSASLSFNHTGSYGTPSNTAAPIVKEQTTADLFLGYAFSQSLKLSLNIKNLMDQNPPWDVGTGLGYSSGQYDLRGRYVRAGLEFKF